MLFWSWRFSPSCAQGCSKAFLKKKCSILNLKFCNTYQLSSVIVILYSMALMLRKRLNIKILDYSRTTQQNMGFCHHRSLISEILLFKKKISQMCNFKKRHKVAQHETTIKCLHNMSVTIYKNSIWGKFVLFEIFTYILALPPVMKISKNMKKKRKKVVLLLFKS